MKTKQLRIAFCAMATLVVSTLGLGASPAPEPGALPAFKRGDRPTPEQAVKYAKTVLLVRRVVQDSQAHVYVKEVWRSGSDAQPPPVGSEYGRPTPSDPRLRPSESDMIVFDFGQDRPKGLPNIFRVSVTERGRVPAFVEEVPVLNDAGIVMRMAEEPMSMDAVRWVVKKTKPEKPNQT